MGRPDIAVKSDVTRVRYLLRRNCVETAETPVQRRLSISPRVQSQTFWLTPLLMSWPTTVSRHGGFLPSMRTSFGPARDAVTRKASGLEPLALLTDDHVTGCCWTTREAPPAPGGLPALRIVALRVAAEVIRARSDGRFQGRPADRGGSGEGSQGDHGDPRRPQCHRPHQVGDRLVPWHVRPARRASVVWVLANLRASLVEPSWRSFRGGSPASGPSGMSNATSN